MKTGYVRRSTREQPTTIATQREALEADGCERIFEDTISGAKSQRPGLNAALDYLRPGDRLVVTRLDRLGRTRVDTLNTMDALRLRGSSWSVITRASTRRTRLAGSSWRF